MNVRLLAHTVWTTQERKPLITSAVADFLTRGIPAVAARHRAQVLGIGMVNDHVHVVLQLPPQIDIPRLVQGLKGATARIANRDGIATPQSLRWAPGYRFESISPRALEDVLQYVANQSKHHPDRAISVRSSDGSACPP